MWHPKSKAGCSNIPVTGTDFYPTLLDLCGLPQKPQQHIDGVSLKNVVCNDGSNESNQLKNRDLFWHYPHYSNQGGDPSTFIRHQDWKLIRYHETQSVELYNLKRDPGEQNDISQRHTKLVKELSEKIENWLYAVGAKMPTVNENFDLDQWNQQQDRIKNKILPRIEKNAANLLKENFQPGGGWWEETGK
ncbi:MAG: sulfatase/phosphatase domain-containing protein [Planctomycetota bacterium]